MTAIRSRHPSWGLLTASSLVFGVLVAGPLAAQPGPGQGNYIDQIRRQNEVVAQKMEADVRAALREAQRLSASDPDKAIERLKRILATLEGDTSLPESRRDALVRMIQDRIRVTEAAP